MVRWGLNDNISSFRGNDSFLEFVFDFLDDEVEVRRGLQPLHGRRQRPQQVQLLQLQPRDLLEPLPAIGGLSLGLGRPLQSF